MSRLEDLDEEVLAIVLRSGLINLNNPGTQYEVSHAIDTALGLAGDEQINIAIMRSVQGQVVASASTSAPTIMPPATKKGAEQPAWIGEAERKRILAHLEAEAGSVDEADDGRGCDTDRLCSICLEVMEPEKQIKLPCGHVWCKKCLCRHLASGLGPGAAWPPKCCDPLATSTIAWLDMPDVLCLWLQAQQQNETPVGEQVHCARPGCGEFIPARLTEQTDATCLVCGENTCRACRRVSHPGRPCTAEAEDEMLKDLMDEKGWSSCPQCSRIIELTAGCNHVTCRCGAEFCFLCGEPFRFTHQCPRYGDHQGLRVPARERRSQYHQGQEDENNRASEYRQVVQEPDHGDLRLDTPWNFEPVQTHRGDQAQLRSTWRPQEARRLMQMLNQTATEDDSDDSSMPSRPWPSGFARRPGRASQRPSSRSMQSSTTVVDPFGNSWAQHTPLARLAQHATAGRDEEVGARQDRGRKTSPSRRPWIGIHGPEHFPPLARPARATLSRQTAGAATGAAPEGLEQGGSQSQQQGRSPSSSRSPRSIRRMYGQPPHSRAFEDPADR